LSKVSTILPKAAIGVGGVIIILVIMDTYIKGGLYVPGLSSANVTNMMAVVTRAGSIVTICMTIMIIQLYYRRLRSPEANLQRKGLLFFVGLAIVAIFYVVYGVLALEFSLMATALLRTIGEVGMFWNGIAFFSLLVRGYMVRSWEGAVMATAGLIELYGAGGLGSFFLPQLGDLGIWIIRYPSMGANNALWLTTYIAAISITGRVLIGKQKLRAAR